MRPSAYNPFIVRLTRALMSRHVGCYRVSTSGQARSGLGLGAQRQAVQAFTGAPPNHEFTELESGKRSDRPRSERQFGGVDRQRRRVDRLASAYAQHMGDKRFELTGDRLRSSWRGFCEAKARQWQGA